MTPWFITEDIVIVEGVGWTWTDLYDPNNVPVDLSSGYTSAWKVRVNFGDLTAVLTLLTGSGIVLGADSSVATTILAAQASALVTSVPSLSAFYAQTLTRTSDGLIIPFKSGAVTIQRNVAR